MLSKDVSMVIYNQVQGALLRSHWNANYIYLAVFICFQIAMWAGARVRLGAYPIALVLNLGCRISTQQAQLLNCWAIINIPFMYCLTDRLHTYCMNPLGAGLDDETSDRDYEEYHRDVKGFTVWQIQMVWMRLFQECWGNVKENG